MSDITVTTQGGESIDITVQSSTSVEITSPASSSVSVTEKGPKGDTGATGPAGADGPAGPGLVSGGTENQFIQKNSATDYDTKWSAYTLPAADGDDGQVLTTNGAATVTFAYPKTIAEDVKNVSGGPLLKGTPVHVTGSVGNLAEVIAADAATNYPAHFVLNEDLDDDAEGLGIAIGFINNVNVPDASIYTEGQTVYLGESGGWTTTKPTGANAIQNLGIIIKVNTSGNKISGIIMGAGRANDVPNIATGNIWAGNADGVATATDTAYIDIFNERVGIGTVTPSSTLHVVGADSLNASYSVKVSNSSAYDVFSLENNGDFSLGAAGAKVVRDNGANVVKVSAGNAQVFVGTEDVKLAANSTGKILFQNSYTNNAVFTNDGKFGIGTTSPRGTLDARGRVDFSQDLRLRGTDSLEDQGVARFYVDNTNKLHIDTGNNGSNLFAIDGSGNVGIGTASPAYPLDVNGNIRATAYRIGGATILSGSTSVVLGSSGATGTVSINTIGGTGLTVDSSSNVGIGTTSPDTELHVESGDAILTLEGSNASYVNAAVQLVSNHASNLRGMGTFAYTAHTDVEWFWGNPYSNNDAFVINRNTGYTVPSSQNSPPGIGASAGTLFKIASSGNVGIGTTSPSEKLHVSGSIRVDTGDRISMGGSGLSMFHSGTYAEVANYTGDFIIRNTAANEDIIFKAEAGTGSDVEIMRIDGSSGNVGIGTTTPEEKLHVTPSVLVGAKGFSAPVAGQLRVASPNASYGELGFTSQYDNFPSGIRSYGLSSNYDRDLRFYTKDTASAADGLERMRITESGNVGIGTTSPSEALDVNGNVKVGTATLRAGVSNLSFTDYGGSGSSRVTIGIGARSDISGNDAVAIGYNVAHNRSGTFNQDVLIGSRAGQYMRTLQSVGVGYNALAGANGVSISAGQYSVAVGNSALKGDASSTFTNTVAIGYQALTALTTGTGNTAVGYQAGYSINTGSYNTALGYEALYDLTTGANNTAVGYQSSPNTNTGNNNVSLGNYALRINQAGGQNTAIGYGAVYQTTSNHNTGVGFLAGYHGDQYNASLGSRALEYSTGSYNVAVGSHAAQGVSSVSNYSNTVAVGYAALNALTTGARNTGVGYRAGAAITSGGANTLFGYEAGDALVGSTYNVAIGEYALSSASDGSFRVAIGAQALENATAAQASNTVAIGFRSGESSTGNNNVLVGHESGKVNTSGNTVAVGYQALTALSTGVENTAVGYFAGNNINTGDYNTIFGYQAGQYITTANHNTLFGRLAGQDVTGSNNVSMGSLALSDCASSNNNVAIGYSAARGTSGSSPNNTVAIGYESLRNVTTANTNVAIGRSSGYSITTGGNNVLLGHESGYSIIGGDSNVMLGYRAGYGSATSTYSNTVAVGYQALTALTTGTGNTALGYQAGNTVTTGINNTILGYSAGGTNHSYTTLVGYDANADGSYGVAIGWLTKAGEFSTSVGSLAGANSSTATYSVFVGDSAGRFNNGDRNVIIGRSAGYSSGTSSDSVFIGYQAGYNETGNNKLYIANSNTSTPLIYGEFDNEILNVNGKLKPNSITVDDEGLSAAGDYGPGAEIWYQGTSTPSAGYCYYLDSTGGWTAAQANASGTATGMLAVSAGTDSDVDGMVLRGFVQISNTLTGSVGDAVYLETSAAGRFTTTKPTGAGNFVRRVGYLAKGTNVIYFNPSPEWEAL